MHFIITVMITCWLPRNHRSCAGWWKISHTHTTTYRRC